MQDKIEDIEDQIRSINRRLGHVDLILNSVGETINMKLDDGFLQFLGISKSDAMQMVMDKGTWFSRIVKLEQKMVSLRPVAMELRSDGKFIEDYEKSKKRVEYVANFIGGFIDDANKRHMDQKMMNQIFLDHMKEKRWWKFWQK